MKIELFKGDITKLEVDAIVNASNRSLSSGGGVCGVIHRAAGKELEEECLKLNGCDVGEAKITRGYKLPAKFVIHTVGPVWLGGGRKEVRQLANCYYNSLKLAEEKGIKTIAFPSISTGTYHFPKDKACKIAIRMVTDFSKNTIIKKVIFVVYSDEDLQIYKEELN